MTFGSLFAGIGGMDLGLERAGMTCKWQVEIDPFCRRVLTKHWPEVPKYGDIRGVTELEPVDVFAGGPPCQDVSISGERRGIGEGTRSGLYREYLRLVDKLRPRFAILENVSGYIVPIGSNGAPIGNVLGDLAERGYDAEWHSITASQFGAPHERLRIFIIAYPSGTRLSGSVINGKELRGAKIKASAKFGNRSVSCGGGWVDSERLRMGDGLPSGVVRKIIKACGNAVVPQVAEWIGRRIIEAAK